MADPAINLHYAKLIDLTGMTFGRWYVLGRSDYRAGKLYWYCHCECGTFDKVAGSNLRLGKTQSCGCWVKVRQHILTKPTKAYPRPPLYTNWMAMRQRCLNPKAQKYPDYGGRGVTICDRWLRSYEAFAADMGPKPSPKHSVERIDNNGNYEPRNCRWATAKEQRANQRPYRKYKWRRTLLRLS